MRYIAIYIGVMRNQEHHGARRRFSHSEDQADRRSGGHHSHHHGGRRGGRRVDHGEVRLLVLALLAEQPRHGYELMKAVEERSGGSYSPSPGVIYPTLAALEDMGQAVAEAADGARKRFRITPEGEAQLAARRADVDELLARIGAGGHGRPGGVPEPVLRAMENLKLALRLRLRRDPVDQAAAETIAAALDATAVAVERS